MLIINKPENEIEMVQCYKCKVILELHPASNLNSPYVTDCNLHKPEQLKAIK